MHKTIYLALLCLTLTSCGLRDDLYLPDENNPKPTILEQLETRQNKDH